MIDDNVLVAAGESKVQERYKSAVREWLGNESEIFLYWKARVGLYAFLDAIGVGAGDEVIMPAFTCVVVPNAVMYLGATPVYVDIELNTYNASAHSILSAVTPRTKVIICQNTFGLSTELEEICEHAKRNGIHTLEDCTHGFGGLYNGVANGLTCDAAIYSTQWNKPFSTGLGGILICADQSLSAKIRTSHELLEKASFREKMFLYLQLFFRKNILTNNNYWTIVRIFRLLSKYGLVVGSSVPSELTSTKMPEGYYKEFTNIQARAGVENISRLSRCLEQRSEVARAYSNFLIANRKNHVKETLFLNHSFLKYPLLVSDRNEFRQRAEQCKIPLGDWFTSPLHPVEGDLSEWGLDRKKYPNSQFAASQMVNLPTSEIEVSAVVKFLTENLDLISDEVEFTKAPIVGRNHA